MKRHLLCVVVVLAACYCAKAEDDDWVKIRNKAAKCEIQFPAKPEEESEEDTKKFILEREEGEAALSLGITKFDEDIDIGDAEKNEEVFENLRDELLKTFKGSKVSSEKTLKFSKKYPAMDLTLKDVPKVGSFRALIIVTPSRLYHIIVAGPKAYQDGAEAKKFRASFKLN